MTDKEKIAQLEQENQTLSKLLGKSESQLTRYKAFLGSVLSDMLPVLAKDKKFVEKFIKDAKYNSTDKEWQEVESLVKNNLRNNPLHQAIYQMLEEEYQGDVGKRSEQDFDNIAKFRDAQKNLKSFKDKKVSEFSQADSKYYGYNSTFEDKLSEEQKKDKYLFHEGLNMEGKQLRTIIGVMLEKKKEFNL
ncbi:MAG: hypothetical protein FWG80_03325 [Alphaproteobacteria bacterium]|nr:hypothetical protein [Alphaproteobacteria bacterium]